MKNKNIIKICQYKNGAIYQKNHDRVYSDINYLKVFYKDDTFSIIDLESEIDTTNVDYIQFLEDNSELTKVIFEKHAGINKFAIKC